MSDSICSLVPTGRQWTWMTPVVERLCPDSGRHAAWNKPAPLVWSGWEQWKQEWGSTSCFLRERPCLCPFSPLQSWASDWDVALPTPRRICSLSPLQTEPVPERGAWTRSQEIFPQSSRLSWSSPKRPRLLAAPCLWRHREAEGEGITGGREGDLMRWAGGQMEKVRWWRTPSS